MLGFAQIGAADTTNKQVSNGKGEEARESQGTRALKTAVRLHNFTFVQCPRTAICASLYVTLRCEDASPSLKEETSMQGISVALSLSILGLLVAQLLEYVVHSTHEPKAGLRFAAFSKDLPPPKAAPPSAEITVEYDRAA